MPAEVTAPPSPAPEAGARRFARRAVVFVVVWVVLYAGLYAGAEWLVYRHAERNRFFQVRTAPHDRYDHVVLGASHAAALDYQDMTERLEALTGARILNLSIVGAGVTVNRVVFEYFLERRTAGTLVYVVDSFAFYSRQWNEDRLKDSRLFVRAPLDFRLARVLLRRPSTWTTGADYLLGFSKINNPERFSPDTHADEGNRFTRTYRAVPQIDEQRLGYLYPRGSDPTALAYYMRQFEELVELATSRGLRVVAVKPPIPARVYDRLPDEASFDARLTEVLDRHGAVLHDFSRVANDAAFFYDTDHLNRNGVLNFFEHHLKDVLVPPRGAHTRGVPGTLSSG